jgi:hypothetical protein
MVRGCLAALGWRMRGGRGFVGYRTVLAWPALPLRAVLTSRLQAELVLRSSERAPHQKRLRLALAMT